MGLSSRSSISTFLSLLLAFSGPVSAAAQVPGVLNYQGRLSDAAGAPVQGSRDLTFRLFESAGAASPLWTETQTAVPVSNGVFSVQLGASTPLSPSNFGPNTHLEIQVGTEVLAPRRPLASVPSALNASRLEGKAASDFLSLDGSGRLTLDRSAPTIFLSNDGGAANDSPVIQWNPINSSVGLLFKVNGTEVARIQDNKSVMSQTFATYAGLYLSDLFIRRGGNGGPQISFGEAAAGTPAFKLDTANFDFAATPILDVRNQGTSRLVVTGAGRVGIGTAAPETALQVTGGASRFHNSAYPSAYLEVAGIGNPDDRMGLRTNGGSWVLRTNGALSMGFGPGNTFQAYGVGGRIGFRGDSMPVLGGAIVGVDAWQGTQKPLILASPEVSENGFGAPGIADLGTVSIAGNAWSGTRSAMRYTASSHIFRVDGGTGQNNPGTSALQIDGSGNVGIGTAAPGKRLDVAGEVRITTNSLNAFSISGGGTNGDIVANVVGVNPVINLRVNTTLGYYPAVQLVDNSAGGNTLIGKMMGYRNVGLLLDSGPSMSIRLRPAGTDAVAVTAAGNVGIGTITPAQLLHVVSPASNAVGLIETASTGGVGEVRLKNPDATNIVGTETSSDSGGGAYPGPASSLNLVTGGAFPIVLSPNGAEALRVQSGGNVGIGTSAPGQRLSVAGIIESTSGGIKFPDGSVQTTAGGGGGGGNVGSTGSGSFRVETVLFGGNATGSAPCSSGSCTLVRKSGNWVSAVNRSSSGFYTISVAPGQFSAPPTCTCSTAGSSGASTMCHFFNNDSTTTTLGLHTLTASAHLDETVAVVCMGPQ